MLPPASVLPALLVVGPAGAAEFLLTPTLSVGQTYTDNVNLAPAGQTRSDWVTSLRPGVNFGYNGANLKFSASYSAELLYRANDSDLTLYNHYNGGTIGSMELVPQFLFLDTTSNVSQLNTSTFGVQPLNNINTVDNRSTVRTTVLSPYARYSFHGEVDMQARYTYSLVDGGSSGRGVNSGSNRFNASAASGAAYKATTWNLNYSWENIQYDQARDTTLQNINLSGRRLITPVLAVVGSVGYEDNNYVAQNSTPVGSIWNAGIDWTPTDRTKLHATAGHRFYGKTYALDFSHRSRLTVWNATYSEDITSTRQQFLVPSQSDTSTYLDTLFLSRIPDPVLRQQAVQQEIARLGLPPTMLVPVNFFTNQFFLQKTFRATAGIQGVMHTLFANVFTSTRTSQSVAVPGAAGDFAASNDVRSAGGSVIWSYTATPFTTSNVSVGYTRSETPSNGRVDDNQYFRASLNHTIGPKTSGVISYQRLHNDSTVATATYTENQVSATVQVKF